MREGGSYIVVQLYNRKRSGSRTLYPVGKRGSRLRINCRPFINRRVANTYRFGRYEAMIYDDAEKAYGIKLEKLAA